MSDTTAPRRDEDVFWQAVRDGYSYEQAEVKAARPVRDVLELGDALAIAAATLLAHTDTAAPADLTGQLGRAVRAWQEGR